jgi:hypothetical protein
MPTQGTAIGAIGLRPTSDQTPATLYQAVNDELAVLWQSGTRAYIEQHQPDLAKQIDQSEARLNVTWLAVEDGTGTLDAFKVVLETWRQANLKAIRSLGGVIVR